MNLNGKDIETQCNRARLIRGKALYASKAVESITIMHEPDEMRKWLKKRNDSEGLKHLEETSGSSMYAVEAEVLGSSAKEYHVELVIDDALTDKFLGASCECQDFIGGTPFCKHCVAVAHNIIMQTLEEQLSDKLVSARELESRKVSAPAGLHYGEELWGRRTARTASAFASGASAGSSSVIGQLIKTYSGSNPSVYWQDMASETQMDLHDVELIPNLVVEHSSQQTIEFKIGTPRKYYVLKDILQFMDNMRKQAYFSYGKQLAFTHDRGHFAADSLYYVDMIADLMGLQQSSSAYGFIVNPLHAVRYLQVSDGYMDQIMERSVGETISVDGNRYDVVRANPKLPLRLEPAEQGVHLSIPNILLLKGLARSYVAHASEHKIYITSDGYQRQAIPFLETMREYKDWKFYSERSKRDELRCYLSERDYTSFCGHVLRKIERYFEVVEQEVDLHEFMPEDCKIKVYLNAEESDDDITCDMRACYGNEEYNLADWTAVSDGRFRDLELEQHAYQVARTYFPKMERSPEQLLLKCESENDIYRLLEKGLDALAELGEVYVSDKIRSMNIRKSPKVTAGVQVQGDLLQLSVDIPDMSNDEIGQILSAYREKRRYYRMKNGDFMQLHGAGLGTLAEMSQGLGIRDKDWQDGSVELPLYRASYIDAVMKERGKNLDVVRSSEFKAIIRHMREVEDSDYEIPNDLTAQLRGYQKTGFRWLLTLSHYGFGGILADDMGLGKTLQIIAMLESVMETSEYDKAASTSLIVCPASLVYNWESEFAKFAPKIRTRLVVGSASERAKLMRSLKHVDVVVTSYDLLKRDLELYENKHFLYMVIDEAQYIKNASTQVARAVKSIGAAHRFALTGTPVENRLSDLWSIFDFIMKGYLYSYEKFRKNFELPIVAERDEEVLRRLQRLTAPFILRRRKKEVLKDLPDKIEQVIYTTMTDEQRKLYNARFLKLKREIAGKSDAQFKEDKMKVLAELTRLRQLCCDPSLFVEGYTKGSGKVDAAIGIIDELVGNGSNILVFSQFATMLEILRTRLGEQGIHTLLLTGQNSKEERRNMVAEFQEGQQTVFLISLKAGGTGLNLTAADTVIHFDPWWNVAAQNQATDRAHRIGQDKVVTVMQLVMKNSIEERIIDLQNRKKELVEDVVEGDGVASASLTKEEIMGLLEEF